MESLDYQTKDEGSIFPLLVLNNALLPLQGFFNMFVYTRPSFARFRAAFPQQTSFWALRKACLDSDIPRLRESRVFNSRGTKSGRNSKKNKSGSNGFASGLSIVQEESDAEEVPVDKLHGMESYNEDLCGTSECNYPGVDSSDERSEDSMDLQARTEILQQAGKSPRLSRMGMDGSVSFY
jgi:hypothetical protein